MCVPRLTYLCFFFLMIRRPPRSTLDRSSAASDVYKRQEWILAAGAEFDVDLIVMATKAQDSLLDMLRGSTTERVLRGARCPLLAIPAKLI